MPPRKQTQGLSFDTGLEGLGKEIKLFDNAIVALLMEGIPFPATWDVENPVINVIFTISTG